MNMKELKTHAKKLNVHVTANSNAANVAQDLFECNQRLQQLEALALKAIPENKVFKVYQERWWK